MSLGLQTESTSGDFLPIIKYDARAGRLFRVDRDEEGGVWSSTDTDITDKAAFIADLANVEIGWISFATGAPNFVMVPQGEPLPQRPTDDHKQGFRLLIKLSKSAGGDVREFSHTAKCVLSPFDAIHTAFVNSKEAKQGKLPILRITGTLPIKTNTPKGTTTNYAPVFEIDKWVDRPDDLEEKTASANANAKGEPEQKEEKGEVTAADEF